MRKDDRLLRDVGRRIAELRHAHGWTQAQLAERLRVNEQHVGHLESGRANMTLRTISRVASLLQVEALELFEPPTFPTQRRPGRPRKARE